MPSPMFAAKNSTCDGFLTVYDRRKQNPTKLLFKAAAHSDPAVRAAIMHRLLDDGADPSAEDEHGSTLLPVLGSWGHDPGADGPLLVRLIAGGADVNTLERRGDRPIDLVLKLNVREADREPYYSALFESGRLNLDLPENRRDPEGRTYREGLTANPDRDRFPVLHAYLDDWVRRNPQD